MRNLAFAILFMATLQSHANTNGLGQQIEPLRDQNGQPRLSVKVSSWQNGVSKVKLPMLAISVTVDGSQIAAGQPVNLISWRLYDLQTEAFIDNPKMLLERATLKPLAAEQDFGFAIGTNSAIGASRLIRRLAVVLYVGSRDGKGTPTHFIALASACDGSPTRFVNELTGSTSCPATKRPELTVQLPTSQGVFRLDSRMFDSYCAMTKNFATEVAKLGHQAPLGVKGALKREQRLADLLCDKSGHFVYMRELRDPNARAIGSMKLVEDGMTKLVQAAALISDDHAFIYMQRVNSFQQQKRVFYDDQLYSIYPDFMSVSDQVSHFEDQVVDLANFYRDGQ
jgi:hypothetical protein